MTLVGKGGWVITWEPSPGRRTIWHSYLFSTRAAAWAYVVEDAVENRGWRIKNVKAALARDGFKVLLATMQPHWHCQHTHRDGEGSH